MQQFLSVKLCSKVKGVWVSVIEHFPKLYLLRDFIRFIALGVGVGFTYFAFV